MKIKRITDIIEKIYLYLEKKKVMDLSFSYETDKVKVAYK